MIYLICGDGICLFFEVDLSFAHFFQEMIAYQAKKM